MKIEFLEAISGPTWGARPGEVLDVEGGEAIRLINAGIAKAVEIPTSDDAEESEAEQPAPAEEIEVAVVPQQETAVTPRKVAKPRKSR